MKKIRAITLEGMVSTNINELFDELQKFKNMFPDLVVKLDMNGTIINAGIYETREQLANSVFAVDDGNKIEILTNLPSNGDALEIAAAIELMSNQMKNNGFEGFSEEEIDSIENKYSKKQLGSYR